MATSYSSSLNSYVNVGPLVFIPGVNNDLTGPDSSNCLQNYPFTDLDAHIMAYQSLTSAGATTTDGTSLPVNTIDINTSIYTTGHAFSSPVSLEDGSNNPAMLATCEYVNTIETLWANYPAVNDVVMDNHDLLDLSQIKFHNSDLVLEASGNYLTVEGNGIHFPNSNAVTSITNNYRQAITFDNAGQIIFTSGKDVSGTWTRAPFGIRLDTYGILHAQLVFQDPAITMLHGVCVNGAVSYTNGPGKLPSILTFPVVNIDATNTVAALNFGGHTDLPTIVGVELVGAPEKQGFMYTLLWKNTDTSNTTIWLSNSEIFVNNGATVCIQSQPIAFAPGTYCLVQISRASSAVSPNPNPYMVDFKGLNSTSMDVL